MMRRDWGEKGDVKMMRRKKKKSDFSRGRGNFIIVKKIGLKFHQRQVNLAGKPLIATF